MKIDDKAYKAIEAILFVMIIIAFGAVIAVFTIPYQFAEFVTQMFELVVIGGYVALYAMGAITMLLVAGVYAKVRKAYHEADTVHLENQLLKAEAALTNARAFKEQLITISVPDGQSLFSNAVLTQYQEATSTINPNQMLLKAGQVIQGTRVFNRTFEGDLPQMIGQNDKDNDMPGLIETMLQYQRLLLIGGSGAGKTNALKHFISELVKRGERLLILDPHSPSKLAGCDVVGSGLDFEAIGNKFVELMLLVNRRYKSGMIAQDGEMGDDGMWVIVDEMRDISGALGELSDDFLEVMLVRARKAGIKFCLVSQNDTTSSLGLKGDKQLFKACERIELKRDVTTRERQAFIGWRASDKVELAMPGLFEDEFVNIPDKQLVVDPPPQYSGSEKKLAITLAKSSDTPTSQNALFREAGVSKNGDLNEFVRRLLEGY